jgi:hypothetical protein
LSTNIKIISFLQKYTEAMTLQISAVQAQLETSVTTVMQSLQELSVSTEQKKAEAERVLEETYLAPSAQTKAMVDSIQHSTDDIFDEAQKLMESNESGVEIKTTGEDMRRMAGMFSKHMESISTLDDSVQALLMAMVGNLSNTDVIQQRLDHISLMLSSVNLGVGNVLVDPEVRLTPGIITAFKHDLLRLVYKSYTIEEERASFKKIFGAHPEFLGSHIRKNA